MQLAVFLKVPVNYFYEDYIDNNKSSETTTGPVQEENPDLNYSFLIKIFSKLSQTQKSKVLQILRNTTDLKETG